MAPVQGPGAPIPWRGLCGLGIAFVFVAYLGATTLAIGQAWSLTAHVLAWVLGFPVLLVLSPLLAVAVLHTWLPLLATVLCPVAAGLLWWWEGRSHE